MKFFDSHIHLNSNSLSGWEEAEGWIFNNVSTTLRDFHIALEQAKQYEHVYVTAGVHPLEIDEIELPEAMEELDLKIRTHRNKVIAIGETGLDFYHADKGLSYDKQRRWFYAQYELAKKYKLPLVLHIRNAHEEALDLLSGLIDWHGVLHCFEATEEILNRYLELPGDWMFSVSPIVLRGTSHFRNLIHKMDINKLLVESDAPFLGKDFSVVETLIEIIAKEKEIPFEQCKEILWNNFCRCFRL